MTRSARVVRWRATLADHTAAVGTAVLAIVAYVPALLSSPGRMPADTKLYLFLDPGGLVRRAGSTFEPDQFAGWVPHQQITYLWPSGPWFWVFDALGVPDWIAHRLWIGTILFLAGWGVHRVARRLGLVGAAALVAALLYQLSPYLLPYISRTSLLLLPWAGLGWIVGLTIAATDRAAGDDGNAGSRERMLGRWREPALIALVVLTVGSANATALVLIAPGPALWLLHAAAARLVSRRAAIAIAVRAAVLCTAVSLWWAAMLIVQSRHGAPVLAYSETLADVSRNSTGSEVLRGLGYWLFYIRDPFGPTTSASLDYLVSTRQLAIGYALTAAGLAGITLTAAPFRRFCALLVATGAILAVGVHPIGSSSPLMTLLAADDGSGLALALRSSTRAVPLLLLGLALGAGSLVAAFPAGAWRIRARTLPRPRALVAGVLVLLVLANLPSLWRFELVDPAISRDQEPPPSWTAAAAALDGGGEGRVLQLPGAEFGAFAWGYTVDQPLVGLTDRPLVTRDLLPLGGAPAMDLLYALDDRFQEGTAEADAVGPVARLLGADSVWVANDADFARFRTARPEVVDALLVAGRPGWAGDVQRFGEPTIPAASVPMIDPTSISDDRVGTPLAPVALVEVADAPGIERIKTSPVLLAGSGDGIVDAAAAGILSGHELVRYTASLTEAELGDGLAAGVALIVTDSNRDRAHHWRGSQDVHGHTEPGGPDDDVLVATNADQRLGVFDTDDPAHQTVAVQRGPVTAVASSYGTPFAYLPEHRAVMAVDGDPATAWLVGEHGDPVGERIRLTIDRPVEELILNQPAPLPGGRRFAAWPLEQPGGYPSSVELTDASTGQGGQRIELASTAAGPIDIEIAGVTTGDQAVAASRAAVGFTEIGVGLVPTVELIRPPTVALAGRSDGPLAIVLTRLRVDPLDRWRADPEPRLAREFRLASEARIVAGITLRLDRRADDRVLAELIGDTPPTTIPVADRRLTGAARSAGRAAFDDDPATAWITPFDGALGATLTLTASRPVGPALEITQPAGELAMITALRLSDGADAVDVTVPPPDPAGRSAIELPAPLAAGPISVTILTTDGASTVDRRFGDVVALPAAIAELTGPGLPSVPMDDDAVVAGDCTPDLLELDGRPVTLSFETTVGALLDGDPVPATVCDGPLALARGEHRLVSTGRATTGLTVDRVVLSDDFPVPAPAAASRPAIVTDDDPRRRVVTVDGCPDGCWLVLGEGFNEAWSARVGGDPLGPPSLVDGGFNGWELPASDGPIEVVLTWTAQTPVTVGLIASAVGVIVCLAIVALTVRRRPGPAATRSTVWRPERPRPRTAPVAALVLVVASALLVGPAWGAIGAVVGAVHVLLSRRGAHRWASRLVEVVGLAAALLVAIGAIAVLRRNRPLPDAGWTASFEQFNGLALFSVVCLAVGAWYSSSPERAR